MKNLKSLEKEFKKLSSERVYAESRHDFDLVEFLDRKREKIQKEINNIFNGMAGI